MEETKFRTILKLLLVITMAGSSFFAFGQDKKAESIIPQKKEVKAKPVETPNPYKKDDVNLHSIGFGVGQTFLNGDFGDNGDDQVTVDLYYDYTASHSFDFVANVHYSKHKYKQFYAEMSGVALSIKGKFYQFDSFAPFALGGLGFYLPKLKRAVAGQIRESESKITFGVNVGLGAELKLNRHFKLWLVIHHHNPFDIKQDVGQEVEGRYSKLLMAGFYTF